MRSLHAARRTVLWIGPTSKEHLGRQTACIDCSGSASYREDSRVNNGLVNLEIDSLERIMSALRADLWSVPEDGTTGRTHVSNNCVRGRIERFTTGIALMETRLTATDIDGSLLCRRLLIQIKRSRMGGEIGMETDS